MNLVTEASDSGSGPLSSLGSILRVAMNIATVVHPDVSVMSFIVQLDVVRLGLEDGEELPLVSITSKVGADSAVRDAAQVPAEVTLESEVSLTGMYNLLHLEFLRGMRILVLQGKNVKVLLSLEPSTLVNIVEGKPLGAEGSLEAFALLSLISSEFSSEEDGKTRELELVSHRSLGADERIRVFEMLLNTGAHVTVVANEGLSERVVDGEAITLRNELPLLRSGVLGLIASHLRRFITFTSHLLSLPVDKLIEALLLASRGQSEFLIIAYGFALVVNFVAVHSQPSVLVLRVERDLALGIFEGIRKRVLSSLRLLVIKLAALVSNLISTLS